MPAVSNMTPEQRAEIRAHAERGDIDGVMRHLDCDGVLELLDARERDWMPTLARNLAVAGFGALMFRAGDNFGFHMGADESQCTCQWSPGEPYRPSSRCEQDDYYDEPEYDLDDFDDAGESATAGPNGCTCGFNGDCNCRFVP